MKKLLLKLFPSYFNVTNVYALDKIDVIGHPYKLAIVDPETNKTFEALGIDNDRIEILYKEIKNAMTKYNCKLQVLNTLEPKIKHINEFYAACMILERLTEQGGLGGLLGMFMQDMLRKRGDQ